MTRPEPATTRAAPVAHRLGTCPDDRGNEIEDALIQAIRLMQAMKGRGTVLPHDAYGQEPDAIIARLATEDMDDPDIVLAERQWVRLACTAADCLDGIMSANNPRDLDLAIHQLRNALARFQRQSGFNVGPSLRDAVLVPVLWRIAVMDRAFGCFIGIGFDPLARRSARLLARHDGGRMLGEVAARRFVARLCATRAFVACPDARCDWSPALGPAGRA